MRDTRAYYSRTATRIPGKLELRSIRSFLNLLAISHSQNYHQRARWRNIINIGSCRDERWPVSFLKKALLQACLKVSCYDEAYSISR